MLRGHRDLIVAYPTDRNALLHHSVGDSRGRLHWDGLNPIAGWLGRTHGRSCGRSCLIASLVREGVVGHDPGDVVASAPAPAGGAPAGAAPTPGGATALVSEGNHPWPDGGLISTSKGC